MRARARGFAFGLLLAAALWGNHERTANAQLAAGLSDTRFEIRTDFAGGEILLFGAAEAAQDEIVAVVRGPVRSQSVFYQQPVFGFWLTTRRARFSAVPGYYAYTASGRVESIADVDVRRALEVGFDAVRLGDLQLPTSPLQAKEWRAALLRRQEAAGLYHRVPLPLEFSGERLFQARFPLPAEAPSGVYDVSVYGLRDGEVTHAVALNFAVDKRGFGAEVESLARSRPHLYALLGIGLSVLFGAFGYGLAHRVG